MKLNEIQSAASLRAASALPICYTDEQIEDFIAKRDAVGWCDALLALPASDACWALAGLLQRDQRQQWADSCARRAREYADAARADAADARYAARAADSAYYAAARAAADSAYYAAAARAAAFYAARAASADADAASDAAYHASDAAYHASDAARDASDAARAASADADADAARAAEYRTAIRHGVALLLGSAPALSGR